QPGARDVRRDLDVDVAGRVQDQRHDDHALRAGRREVQPVLDLDLGELDEAQLGAPVRMARAPERGELLDLVVAALLARAVADQQDGVFHGAVAFRKRWVNAASYSFDLVSSAQPRAPSAGLAMTIAWLT